MMMNSDTEIKGDSSIMHRIVVLGKSKLLFLRVAEILTRKGIESLTFMHNRLKYSRYLRTLLIVAAGVALGQEYHAGDYFSVEDQQIPFEICANGNGQQTLQLAEYNYALNGGDHYVIWLDIFAAD
ncbi:MAG: hypothetical protein GXO91_07070 [FCB group bacterium]|nr:hypothetical protein [FCB group bacterium]